MSGQTIVSGGGMDDGLTTFNQSVLDQAVPYPADFAALPSSTPNVRRKSRRSWFENTPKGFKFEIAVEDKKEPPKKPVARKSESMEVLTLSHFSAAPRLGFGTMKPGQTRMCTLMLRNPHDYEQTVKVEKVPEKKYFTVNSREFVVGPQESYPLEITWSPQEAGGCREMLLMQVDGSYRVQAYVFGTVNAPPPKKKTGKRTGLLASKVSKPFSVIHTTSLANINQQYSPEKKTTKPVASSRSNLGRTTTKAKGVPANTVGSRGSRGRGSGEMRRRSGRLSGQYKQSDDKQLQKPDLENTENIEPSNSGSRKSSGRGESCETKQLGEAAIPRKKLRRSNTYSNVSVGMLVPVIHNDEVKGHTDTSLLNIDNCNISGIRVLEEPGVEAGNDNELASFLQKSPETSEQVLEPSFLIPASSVQSKSDRNIPKQKLVNYEVETENLEPSFLVEEQIIEKVNVVETRRVTVKTVEKTSTLQQSKVESENLEPSFIQSSKVMSCKTASDDSYQGILDMTENDENTQPIEQPSFLESETKTAKPRRSLRKRSGQFAIQDLDLSGVKLLRSAKKSQGKDERKSRRSLKKRSLEQSPLLKELKNLRSFLRDKSLEIENSVCEVSQSDTVANNVLDRRETFIKQEVPRFSLSVTDNIRRGTFVTEPAKLQLLETQKPSEASPRRTTFTVMKNNVQKKHVDVHQHAASPLQEEDEETSGTTSRSNSDVLGANTEDGKRAYSVDSLENDSLEDHKNSSIEKKGKLSVEASSNIEKLQCSPQSTGHRQLSVDSLENETFEKQFGSPQQLPCPLNDEDFTRRATLTVTKLHPSDALLKNEERRQSRAATSLFSQSPNALNRLHNKDGSLNETDGARSSQNSTFEVSADRSILLREAAFQATPNHLPTSPNPDHSRRSTHVVAKPKVVNLSSIGAKQLFSSDDAQSNNVEPKIVGETDMNTEDSNNLFTKETVIEEMKTPPSCNTRSRKLSAKRRSLNNLRRSSTESNKVEEGIVAATSVQVESVAPLGNMNTNNNNQGSTCMETFTQPLRKADVPEELFFIPIDKAAQEPKKKMATRAANPKQFLKKRSNALVQEVDVRTKRVRSDLAQTVPAPQANNTRIITRQATKPTTGMVKSARQPQKPKTGNMMKGLAQSKLILTKKSKSAIPKHPLPFAAKNMFYDERWMEKQERGFVNWLNFILTPADEVRGNDVKVKVDAGKLTLDVAKGRGKLAPTNEILSFRAYSALRKLNRLRKSACRLFQSEDVRRVMQKVEMEVESKRLHVRQDKMLHADVGAKQRVLDMLLSYNPLWLRVGLETIYGEIVPLQSNTDVYGLSRFIITRLLSSPDIAQQFAHPTVPHLYRDGYAESMSQHTLKKFLMLVYYLDQAKQNRLIEHNPCLFCKDADSKASKDLLLQFSRDFLSGEGDITRHLGYLGYKVTYTQTALDEFDFAVKSLATELRDGVRLTRVMEMLGDRTDLSSKLRMPAISRLQKIHNVKIVFHTLAQQHIKPEKVSEQDIVDGHRERTLRLLWDIILHYQVAMVLNLEQLREEIAVLEKSLSVKQQLNRLALLQDGVDTRRDSHGGDLHTQDERLNLLLKWCRAVCAHFNIKIENFTVSFSDGRALCHILHYYHPGLLPLASINNATMMTHMQTLEERCNVNMDASMNDSINSATVFGEMEDPTVVNQLLGNEKDNYKLLAEKVKELGGVPMMLHWSDMSNTIPDEKVVVTYLLYLCARLLDIRHESRAARIIQHAWHAHWLRKMKKLFEEKGQAVIVLQRAVRRFLDRRRVQHEADAALCIQKVWRGRVARQLVQKRRLELSMQQQISAVKLLQTAVKRHLYRRRYQQMKTSVIQVQAYCRGYLLRQQRSRAALTIQRFYRGYRVRQHVQQLKTAVTVIQAHIRAYQIRKQLQAQHHAARVIQCRYRAHVAMRKQAGEYASMKKASIEIQRHYRGFHARKRFCILHAKVVKIQASVRGHLQRQKLSQMHRSATLIQRKYRGHVASQAQRMAFLELKSATIIMQAQRQMVTQRRVYLATRSAAITIQAAARMMICKRTFQRQTTAALTLQRHYRARVEGNRCRGEYLCTVGAIISMQARRRMVVQRREYLVMKSSAVKVQAMVRMWIERSRFQQLKAATLKMQSWIRCRRMRKAYKCVLAHSHSAATTIQSAYRRYQARKTFLLQRGAAIHIQSCYRRHYHHTSFMALKTAATTCQRRYRAKQLGCKVLEEYRSLQRAVTTLQATARGRKCRQEFLRLRKSAVMIQSLIRMIRERRAFLRQRQAVVVIQEWYRGTVCTRNLRRQFLIKVGAATAIQAAYKGYMARCRYHRILATRKIQSYYRMLLARRQYLATRQKVICCQSAVRMYIEKKKVGEMRKQIKAAVAIQQMWRAKMLGQEQRDVYLKQRRAAITLQTHFRARKAGVECRHEYIRILSARKIQSCYRMLLARREYLVTKQKVIRCQSVVRMYIDKKKVEDLRTKTKAAVTIQQMWRASIEGSTQREAYVKLRQAAITLQTYFRARVAGDQCRQEYVTKVKAVQCMQACRRMVVQRRDYLRMKSAAVVIQSSVRMRKYRSELLRKKQAALTIQSYVRGRRVQKAYKVLLFYSNQAATTIQSAFRGHMARQDFLQKKRAAVAIQACFRGHIQCKRYKSMKKAVVLCQRSYRAKRLCRMSREQYGQMKIAAVRIQSVFRGRRCRQEFTRLRSAAVTLQSVVRMRQARATYMRYRQAAVSIQNWYRTSVVTRNLRQQFFLKVGAAIIIQSAYKRYVIRSLYLKVLAAIKIQKNYRMHVARQRYLAMRSKVVICQSVVRRFQARKCVEQLRTQRKVIVCQSAVRGYLARKSLEQLRARHNAAVVLQSQWRARNLCLSQRAEFLKQKQAALVIQNHIYARNSGRQCRRDFLMKRKAVVTLQAAFRVYLVRKQQKLQLDQEKLQHRASTQIQSVFRGYLVRREYQRLRGAVLVCQKLYRARQDREKFQEQLIQFKAALAKKKQLSAVIRIQSVWKGYCVRRDSTSKKLLKARVRIQEANASATEEKKLVNRTASALDFLLKYKDVSHLLEALMHLDTSTRLSWLCCERIVETHAISVLYTLLRSCNRSVPHMKIIEYVVNILLNLAKYEKTRPSVYEDETGLGTLLELMTIYREKGAIFSRTCNLLGILALEQPCKDHIIEDKKFVNKLVSIRTLTARKHKLEETQRVTRARMNATFNVTFNTTLRSPVKQQRIKPAWLLNKDKMRDLENPLAAINFVFTSLGMKTN